MENLPTPLSRVELYLAKACGMDVTVPEQPLSRLEQFLAILAGDTSITMPTPMSLTEQWLAYVLGGTPDPLLVVEGACLIGAQKVDVRYFAVATSMPGATLPEAPQNRAEMYWAHIAGNPPTPGILKYVTGKYFYLTDVVSGIEELQYVKGDTYQQTYSGKNLFNISAVTSLYTYQSNYSINNNQITITSTASSGTSYALIKPLYTFKKNTTYTVSFKYTGNLNRIVMFTSNSVTYGEASTTNTLTFTTSDSEDTMNLGIYPTLGNSITVYDIQFEEGNQATSYEPFTGSTPTQITPAPNPDYPQYINVVTGEQTVTVSDGVDSEDFTISLGSTELCKIGDYQDYIYKSGDDWYVHKEVGKYIFDGSESWTAGIYGTNSWILANVIMTQYDTAKAQILSTKFRGVANNDRSTSGDNVIYTASNYQVWIRNTSLTSLADVQTATSGTPAYYYLATPTDTKITDATLISQLNALNSAPLPKPIANITVSATGTNLTPYLTIAYYGSDEE